MGVTLQPILVPSLRIEAASGPTCYADEGGFSSVLCEFVADTPELSSQLNDVIASGGLATVRCGLLEVTGSLKSLSSGEAGSGYRLHLETVRFGPPSGVA
jgi:hypothetical protein